MLLQSMHFTFGQPTCNSGLHFYIKGPWKFIDGAQVLKNVIELPREGEKRRLGMRLGWVPHDH